MKNITTKELSKELVSREGVNSLLIEPYSEVTITTGNSKETFTGPAVIIINQD